MYVTCDIVLFPDHSNGHPSSPIIIWYAPTHFFFFKQKVIFSLLQSNNRTNKPPSNKPTDHSERTKTEKILKRAAQRDDTKE
jgi:hypothetical protein